MTAFEDTAIMINLSQAGDSARLLFPPDHHEKLPSSHAVII